MAEQKDPTQITLREAAELYRTQGIGTQKITRFNKGNSLSKYGDIPVVEAFAGERGSRLIDTMLAETKTPGAYNDLTRDLRFVSIPVRRDIALIDPNSPVISSFPGADAADEQTKIVFGPRKATDVARDVRVLSQNRQGWGELFATLEEIASNPSNPKAAVADAVLATLYTGPRGGLIANLKGDEYKPDSASVRVMPQTKEKKLAGEKKDAGAQKEGGLRGKAIPYNVPLSEEGTAYVERRLKFNENNPKVREFLEKSGENRIFIKVNEKGIPSKVTTGDMSKLLAEIEVSEPLIEDAVSGETYKSLYPKEVIDKTTGKWGEALARDFHAAVALNELEISGQTVDFLHGRSETSGTAGRSQTRKLGYGRRATSYFTEGERNAQQRIANFIGSFTGKTAADIPEAATRVTPATYSIPGFFDKPASSAPPPAAQPIPAEKPAPTSLNDLSPETKSAMEKAGFKFRSAAVAGLAALKAVPGPAADLLGAIGEEALKDEPPLPMDDVVRASALTDPYGIALLEGSKFAQKTGIPEFMGKLGATTLQLATELPSALATRSETIEREGMKVPSMMQEAQDRQYDFGDEFGNIPDDEQGFVPKREKEADPRITI